MDSRCARIVAMGEMAGLVCGPGIVRVCGSGGKLQPPTIVRVAKEIEPEPSCASRGVIPRGGDCYVWEEVVQCRGPLWSCIVG